MILEFYSEGGQHPKVFDYYLDRYGYPRAVMPKPRGIEGVRQFVLQGDRPSPRQLECIKDVFRRRPNWTPIFFFEECPY
ncbi:hypothetical protein [Mesorhizobium sp. BR-1-1-10]|uniref:hypothetical protein n=1 Tax=Mesorhizobium sp. BR-1-1-10 TaxID=2876660 RepID=UPI001CD0BB38|nr:hypothetical protein [Mesorhizobium sp. BR-1-1-10]MBZ9975515.1 hypothetical protein [Mesorhizobium sp. BR-1-1-10]